MEQGCICQITYSWFCWGSLGLGLTADVFNWGLLLSDVVKESQLAVHLVVKLQVLQTATEPMQAFSFYIISIIVLRVEVFIPLCSSACAASSQGVVSC